LRRTFKRKIYGMRTGIRIMRSCGEDVRRER
jgi:hypothetical protein